MKINNIALCIIIFLLLFSVYCALNIGLSWDEVQRHWQGAMRTDYFKSLEFGKFEFKRGGWSEIEPGLYDTFNFAITDLLLKIFPGKLIGIKHSINLTFSLLSLIGLFLLSKKIFNKEIAYLATLLCFLNPFFFGHMSMNPIDTIISFSLIWFAYSIYLYCVNFEKKRLRFLILASFFMGFGLGTRLPFLIVPVPIMLTALIYVISKYSSKFENYKIYKKIFFDFLIFTSIAFFLMVLAWPFFHNTPSILLEAFNISTVVKYPHGPVQDIINGDYYEMTKTPRTYFFSFFIFRMPIFILILFFTLIITLKVNNNFFTSKFSQFKKKIIIIFSIVFFPVILHLIFQVKIYNGIRLFLFIIPFLSLLLAIGLYYLLQNFRKSVYVKYLLVTSTIFFLLFLQRFFYLTPYHYDYSNFFNIKFSNTEKLYIHDYWAASYKELMESIKANPDLKEIKADFCGGHFFTLKYLAHKYSGKKVTLVPYKQADYIIMINTVTNVLNNKSSCFLLRPGKDIVTVERLGVKFSVLRKLDK